MSIDAICERDVVTIEKNASVREAAKLMKEYDVGNVVVIEDEKPVGIVTDRDLATKVLGNGIDLNSAKVQDAMSADLLVLKSTQGIKEAIDAMSSKSVRRAPVVDDSNKLVGIVSVDDLLVLMAQELNSLADLIRKQVNA